MAQDFVIECEHFAGKQYVTVIDHEPWSLEREEEVRDLVDNVVITKWLAYMAFRVCRDCNLVVTIYEWEVIS